MDACDLLKDRYRKEHESLEWWTRSRPAICEAMQVFDVGMIARETHGRVYIPHVSSALAVTVIRDGKRRGVHVTAETCPQYLALTQDSLLEHGPYAKCNPPLKTKMDNEALWEGLRDGTIDTPDGKRPNPLRYYRSHQNVSYFSLLAAAGYRIAPWLSVGAGLQWMMVIYESTTWTTPISALDPESDVRGDLFGRDLFVPGVIASAQFQPIDALDIVVGFKWSDRVKSNGPSGSSASNVSRLSGGTGQPREPFLTSSS